jgi:hypothetical protein
MSVSQEQREAGGIDARRVVVGALAALLLIAMSVALVRLLATSNHNPTVGTNRYERAPVLSTPDEVDELHRYQVTQAHWLDSYGWKDKAHRFAHIPITRAMQLLIRQPALAQPSGKPPAHPSRGKPGPLDEPRSPRAAPPLAPAS